MQYFPSFRTSQECADQIDRFSIEIRENGFGFFAVELKSQVHSRYKITQNGWRKTQQDATGNLNHR